jgi:hypothetical protein
MACSPRLTRRDAEILIGDTLAAASSVSFFAARVESLDRRML